VNPGERAAPGRPRLIVVYGFRSLSAIQLAEASHGVCDLVWLIDAQDQAAAAVRPLLQRSGTVVDALGMSPVAAAEALRPLTPDGIATFYDTGMEHVAAIAAELGLPFNGTDTARSLEDKYYQREALRASGLPTPPVVSIRSDMDPGSLLSLADQIEYPAVLKPRRASGSWHTFVVADASELNARLAELGQGPPEDLIVEGYLSDGDAMPAGFEADYVSVETVVADGEMTHLAITGRFPLVEPLRETGFFIPSTLDAAASDAVIEVAAAALRALGFTWGCAHTEIKLTAEGPQVIEINGRIGGGVPEMLNLVASVDPIALAMRAALGLELGVPSMPETQGVAYRFFYQPPASARRLVALEGLDDLARRPGVDDVFMHHRPGTELDARNGTRTYLFAVVGSVDDHAGVVAMHEHLEHAIDAVYEE
jgi:biotin carboxylase